MTAPLILSLLVGIFTVLQGGLNKKIGIQYGLTGTLVINSIFVLIFSLLLHFIVNETKIGGFPPYMKLHPDAGRIIQWWYFIPGLCGFFIILGIPYGIIHIGALFTMALMICTQVTASIFWDVFIEQIPLSPLRLIGGGLTILGAALASFR